MGGLLAPSCSPSTSVSFPWCHFWWQRLLAGTGWVAPGCRSLAECRLPSCWGCFSNGGMGPSWAVLAQGGASPLPPPPPPGDDAHWGADPAGLGTRSLEGRDEHRKNEPRPNFCSVRQCGSKCPPCWAVFSCSSILWDLGAHPPPRSQPRGLCSPRNTLHHRQL